MRYYVVADIHGFFTEMIDALNGKMKYAVEKDGCITVQ